MRTIRELRKDRGLTLAEVSEGTGISVSFLSDVERGKSRPSLDTVETLAGFYGITESELVGALAKGINGPAGFDSVREAYDAELVRLRERNRHLEQMLEGTLELCLASQKALLDAASFVSFGVSVGEVGGSVPAEEEG